MLFPADLIKCRAMHRMRFLNLGPTAKRLMISA
jgi:hypothetical protein